MNGVSGFGAGFVGVRAAEAGSVGWEGMEAMRGRMSGGGWRGLAGDWGRIGGRRKKERMRRKDVSVILGGYKSREVMCSCTFCLEAVSVPATK